MRHQWLHRQRPLQLNLVNKILVVSSETQRTTTAKRSYHFRKRIFKPSSTYDVNRLALPPALIKPLLSVRSILVNAAVLTRHLIQQDRRGNRNIETRYLAFHWNAHEIVAFVGDQRTETPALAT
jgi:hypothetical protein